MVPEKLFELSHSHIRNPGHSEFEEIETKTLYYSFSEDERRNQIAFYRELPGFKDHPDNFHVSPVDLDRRYWETGFFIAD